MEICPSLEQLAMPGPEETLLPLHTTLMSDLLTPISAYLKLSHLQRFSFLFESVSGGEKIGRFSILGADPRKVLTINDGRDPLAVLEEELAGLRSAKNPDLGPLTGGAVGFLAYDCVRYFEPKTAKVHLDDPLGLPDAVFMLCDTVVVFDHLFQSVKIISNFHASLNMTPFEIRLEYSRVASIIRSTFDTLTSPDTPLPPQPQIDLAKPKKATSNRGKDGYADFVRQLKDHIVEGDIIQAVPSQRLSRPTDLHPFNVYRSLRSLNPSPYMFYLNVDAFQIIGASPELLVKVQDGLVTTHPIAGTRRRGKTPAEDLALEKELLSDLKERSEHIMLVDLGRNDVNRVCDHDSVKVTSLMHIEKYSHVMHIVSNVQGILQKSKTVFDAFRSIFPAGTVSGAPKVKAMELVYSLEREKRGIYAGAVGYFAYDGNIDTCIAIRTMLFRDGVAYIQAGGGIVFDSKEVEEWEETMNKAMGNIKAIELAEVYWSKPR